MWIELRKPVTYRGKLFEAGAQVKWPEAVCAPLLIDPWARPSERIDKGDPDRRKGPKATLLPNGPTKPLTDGTVPNPEPADVEIRSD